MEIVLWVVGGIVGLNAGLVAMAAILTAVREHRRRREIRSLESQWRLEGAASRAEHPALTPQGRLVRASSAEAAPALMPGRRRGVPVTSGVGGQGPPSSSGGRVRSRPSRGRTPGRRALQVVVFAVVVCAGTALASSDARDVVTSALGAIARAFGLDSGPDRASRAPESPNLAQPVQDGVPRVGTAVGPARGNQSVKATDTRIDTDPERRVPFGPVRGFSPPAPPTPPTTAADPPSAPDVVIATPVSSTQIDLEWTDVATETGYRIDRSPDGATGWDTIAATGQDVTTYTDVGLLPSTTYFYRVFASNADGDSTTSSVTSATTPTDPPSAPDLLVVTLVTSTQIDLEWTDVATETGYRIDRSLDGENEWGTIGTTGQDVTTYSDVGLLPGTTYFYRVIATNAGGDSPTSAVTSATTATDPPSPPDDLIATTVSSTQIDLEWTDVATETGYRIERSPDGETGWSTLGTTARDVTKYSDVDLSPGTSYHYRVIATNAGGDSRASIVRLLTTMVLARS